MIKSSFECKMSLTKSVNKFDAKRENNVRLKMNERLVEIKPTFDVDFAGNYYAENSCSNFLRWLGVRNLFAGHCTQRPWQLY